MLEGPADIVDFLNDSISVNDDLSRCRCWLSATQNLRVKMISLWKNIHDAIGILNINVFSGI